MKVIAENLAGFMKSRRGSQAEIARRCGIEPPTVHEWATGKRSVPEKYVPVICEILGVTENDLCQKFTPFQQSWMRTPKGQVLLEIAQSLSDEGLTELLAQALRVQQSEKGQRHDS